MAVSLKWTQILIAIQKYMNLSIASIFLAAGLMDVGAYVQLPAWVLIMLGTVFLGVAISLGLLQNGLANGRRWSRLVAISISLLGLVSILFPLALASAIELFRKDTKEAFLRSGARTQLRLDFISQARAFLKSQTVAGYFLVGMILFFSITNYLTDRGPSPGVEIKATQSGR